jgi:predicted RNase H-like nuclease (RuvC/YqgF family)
MTTGIYVLEHRAVAAATIGRPLKQSEVVHHVNGEKLDNRPENLVVTKRADHSQEHREIEKRFAMLMAEVESLRTENQSLRSRLASYHQDGHSISPT